MINFPKIFPNLESERLFLNEISINDSDFLFEIRNNDEVNKYIGRNKPTLEQVNQFITDRISDFENQKGIVWMIYHKESKQNIGSICLWNFNFENSSAEIGYELLPTFHSKGFMKEALSKVINFGFNQLNLQTIEAFTVVENQASINTLLKFNFIENKQFKDTEEENLIMFNLTSTQL